MCGFKALVCCMLYMLKIGHGARKKNGAQSFQSESGVVGATSLHGGHIRLPRPSPANL